MNDESLLSVLRFTFAIPRYNRYPELEFAGWLRISKAHSTMFLNHLLRTFIRNLRYPGVVWVTTCIFYPSIKSGPFYMGNGVFKRMTGYSML